MHMKVFLCVPPALKSGSQIPDLGLGYIAASLRKTGHDVRILQDERDPKFEQLREALREYQPDIVGIKTYSLEIKSVKQAIAIAKSEVPGAPVILGGPHVSIAPPEDSMNYFDRADYAIRGEAEIAFPKFLDVYEADRTGFREVPGLVYRESGKILSNPPLIHSNLDDFEDPAWDLIDPRKFPDRWYFWTPEHPGAPMLTSRGCPYRCTFCAQNVVTGKQVRRRSLDRVFKEMEHLITEYGVHDFDFTDDNFLMDYAYVHQFCEGVLERGWKIRWNCCGARVDFLDKELVKLMDRAGCNVISVGFESGSKRMLDYMRKDLDLELARIKAKLIRENTSIKIMGLFIIGYPTETEEEIRKTIRYSLSLPLFNANFNTYIILPGCEEYDRLKASGEIEEVPWEKLSLDEHVYSPKGLPLKRLKHLYWLAHLKFYLRPLVLLRMLAYSWRRLPKFAIKSIRILLWRNV